MSSEQRDVLIVRSLCILLLFVYILTVYVVALVVLSIVGIQFNTIPFWLVHLPMLGLIGFSILPVNRWLYGNIEQLIFGWPDDPYGALSQMQASLMQSQSPAAIVPAVATIVVATLKLPYAAIVNGTDGETVHVGIPPEGALRVMIPLTYGENIVGSLEVAGRRSGATLSTSEMKLLSDLARYVGITLHAAQLSEALQVSRAQLVVAREEERRRIRRDLHDGLGPTLASMRLQLGAAHRTLRSEPAAAEALLDELRADVRDATAMIRRLVYDLRPPLLDEHGLVGALKNLSRLIEPTTLHLTIPETLPSLPAAVEVALYRIAAEALHNVARHAHADICTLNLEFPDDSAYLHICDNGVGLPAGHRPGVGLTTMQERAEELEGSLMVTNAPEGGLSVIARIPRRKRQ